MVFLIKASQLILSLSILVVLHELGHFIPAKLFKTRVEKFYLFFNPGFSLFKMKKGETEYGIGWLPLGGYVKIAGMIDESMDTEQMKQPAQPWEFRSKKAWQRLIIMSGGVIVNLILGFLIYAMMVMVWGVDELDPKEIKHGLAFESALHHVGFQDGDNIVAFDDETLVNFNDVIPSFMYEEYSKAVVERDGQRIDIPLPQNMGSMLVDSGVKRPVILRTPNVIDSVFADTPAMKAGLLTGDRLIGIDGVSTPYFQEFVREIKSKDSLSNVVLTVEREGQTLEQPITISSEKTIGYKPRSVFEEYHLRHIEYGFFESIGVGFGMAKSTLQNYVTSLRFLFSANGAKQVGSFVTLGSLYGDSWDWQRFWKITAFLSLVLAVMNLLPIPALDGGHILFLIYEMIAGKPAPEKFLERAQMVGVAILIALMVLAIGNDLIKVFTNQF